MLSVDMTVYSVCFGFNWDLPRDTNLLQHERTVFVSLFVLLFAAVCEGLWICVPLHCLSVCVDVCFVVVLRFPPLDN